MALAVEPIPGNRFAPFVDAIVRKARRGEKANRVQIEPAYRDFGLEPGSLVEFVLTARIDLLAERTYDPEKGWTVLAPELQLMRGEMAKKLELSDSGLTKFLQQPKKITRHPRLTAVGRQVSGWAIQRTSPRFKMKAEVSAVEAQLQMFAIRDRGATPAVLHASGTITTFWQEMLGSGETALSASAEHARWFHDLVEAGPQNAAEALMAGEALLSLLSAASSERDANLLVDAHRDQVTRTVRGLFSVATRSPGRGAMPAVHLLAQLGCLPVQWDSAEPSTVANLVVEHVTTSPVGFRSIPILTRMLKISTRHYGVLPPWWSRDGKQERRSAWTALEGIREVYDRDPYPARSFWVEAMTAVRMADSKQFAAEALKLLEARARVEGRPVRERAYAAYCVYLALGDSDADRVRDVLQTLQQPSGDSVEPESGLKWAAKVITMLLDDNMTLEELLLTRGDTSDELDAKDRTVRDRLTDDLAVMAVDTYLYPDLALAQPSDDTDDSVDCANAKMLLRVPDTIRDAFVGLTRYALLSIDGTGRRRAVEALREAGVASEAACLILQVMEDEGAPVWVREHAAFLLGHLTDPAGIDSLLKAAYGKEKSKHPPVRSAAIWALGDIAHPDPVVIETLLKLTESSAPEQLAVLRAATYSLATLHPEPHEDLHMAVVARLEELAGDKNSLIADFAKWGLVERQRARARRDERCNAELWGVAPDLRRTLESSLEAAP